MEYDVYRKETNAENYIHYFSAHPTKTKTGVIIGFFLRAFRICSYKYIDSEITRIYDAFIKRGYPRHFISDALKKARGIFYGPKKEKQSTIRVSLPKTSVNNKIKEALKQNVDIVEKSDNTLRKMLSKGCKNSEACVYSIPCKDCSDIYIG